MELKQREKTLLIVTVPLVLMAGWILFSAWWAPLQALRQHRDDLTTEVERNKKRVAAAREAKERLQQWNRRSLPADTDAARTQYHGWLYSLVTDVGFDDASVDVVSGGSGGRRRATAYRTLGYRVKADATLEQLTEFLFRFRSAGYLHRIRNATIDPSKDFKTLGLSFTVEALSLPDARSVAVDVTEGVFDAPANPTDGPQPELVYTGKEGKLVDAAKLQLTGFRGSEIFDFVRGKALKEVESEINKQTQDTGVTASLDGDKLYLRSEGPDADDTEGPKLDEYREAIVQRNIFAPYTPPAVERGPAPKPPPPPRFDPSKFAYMTGIVRGFDGQPKAFVIARTSGEKFELSEGESFEVGDVQATVVHINRRDAEIEFDGKRWLVPLGDNLRQAKPLFDESEEDEAEEQESAQESPQQEPEQDEAEQPAAEQDESPQDEPEQAVAAEEEAQEMETAEEEAEEMETAEEEGQEMETATDEPLEEEPAQEEGASEP